VGHSGHASEGTSVRLWVTADMRAVKSMSVGDAFPTEDVKGIVSWMATKSWFSVLDPGVFEYSIRRIRLFEKTKI
jgi:hypothetical protein